MTPRQLLDFVRENFQHSPRVDIMFDGYLNVAPDDHETAHYMAVSISNLRDGGGVVWSMDYVQSDMSGIAESIRRTVFVNAMSERREKWFREHHIEFWRRKLHKV